MNSLVFGKPFLSYHRSGHFPRPWLSSLCEYHRNLHTQSHVHCRWKLESPWFPVRLQRITGVRPATPLVSCCSKPKAETHHVLLRQLRRGSGLGEANSGVKGILPWLSNALSSDLQVGLPFLLLFFFGGGGSFWVFWGEGRGTFDSHWEAAQKNCASQGPLLDPFSWEEASPALPRDVTAKIHRKPERLPELPFADFQGAKKANGRYRKPQNGPNNWPMPSPGLFRHSGNL